MTEYTVHFQKGSRVGARSLRMVHVEAQNAKEAYRLAREQFNEPGYRHIRTDHFDGYRLVIDQ